MHKHLPPMIFLRWRCLVLALLPLARTRRARRCDGVCGYRHRSGPELHRRGRPVGPERCCRLHGRAVGADFPACGRSQAAVHPLLPGARTFTARGLTPRGSRSTPGTRRAWGGYTRYWTTASRGMWKSCSVNGGRHLAGGRRPALVPAHRRLPGASGSSEGLYLHPVLQQAERAEGRAGRFRAVARFAGGLSRRNCSRRGLDSQVKQVGPDTSGQDIYWWVDAAATELPLT